ncbi:YidC/Oxa1 family membrane protein insertase [Candidatus Dojkabacteria bacterium]|nr:YidC/Oxa1 family membrane protein insertase [Candidatus Dojkabacteria bacterium]
MLATIWNTIFFEPILNALLILYGFLGENLGIAIIVLTVALRLLLFPLMRSQLDSTRKLRKIQPQLEKIREKYKKNPQKIQEEQLKLYKQVGYNPMGCLASVVLPYPFLIAIYQAIRAFSGGKIGYIYPFVKNLLDISGDVDINTRFLLWDLSKAYLPLAKEHGYFTLWVLAYLLLALLTGLSQYFSVEINQRMTGTASPKKDDKKKSKKKDVPSQDMGAMMNEMGKSMKFTFPLMTVFIALSAPAAVALYWMVQSWVMIGIQYVYYKFKNNKDE